MRTTPTLWSFEQAVEAVAQASRQGQRVALVGPSGSGKSTLAALAADAAGVEVALLSADPGRPSVPGQPPGALALAWRAPAEPGASEVSAVLDDAGDAGDAGDADPGAQRGRWRLSALEGLGTMDCARYRLPLVVAAQRLLTQATPARGLILDTPGIWRGAQAIELLVALCEVARVDLIVALSHDSHMDDSRMDDSRMGESPMLQALGALGARLGLAAPDERARRPSESQRQRERDEAWRRFLIGARVERLALGELHLAGSPPPRQTLSCWEGFQAVLLDARGQTLGLGQLLAQPDASGVALRWARHADAADDAPSTLLLRDARVLQGKLRTERARPLEEPGSPLTKAAASPAPQARADGPFTARQRPSIRIRVEDTNALSGGSIRVTFLGDLFEDPMVLLRLEHHQRCLWFDAGEVAKVPTKLIHQTTDIFMSHAHLDHFGDWPWLLRRMMGLSEPIRVFGPEGIIERVEHMMQAFTWDRVGERGPRLMVHEWDGGPQLRRALVRAGARAPDPQQPLPVGAQDQLWREPQLTVRAAVLDHGGLPVLAYALEQGTQWAVRGNLLRERGWRAGAWLGQLKRMASSDAQDQALDAWLDVEREDGAALKLDARQLASELLIARPGQKIVYATDLADSDANRQALVALARGAELFICEASFIMDDLEQAQRTGHMTTHGAARLAHEAQVRCLVPFHHSMRYEQAPQLIYQEILPGFARTYVPEPIRALLRQQAQQQRAIIASGG